MQSLARPRLIRGILLGALLLTVSGIQDAPTAVAAPQTQQASEVILVNSEEEFIERRSNGGFRARPILNVQPEMLAYGVKNPVDGSWLTALYLVQEKGKRVSDGWEYTIDYPAYEEQPELDPNRAYTLALYAQHQGELHTFEKTIPVYEPTSLWDRVIEAFNPARWARSFAGWVVEGVHGLLCSVLSRVTGSSLEDCRS